MSGSAVYGLEPGTAFRNAACAQCKRKVKPMDDVFFDVLAVPGEISINCKGCGTMLRFHRKKAAERGEAELPLSIAEVDERLAKLR